MKNIDFLMTTPLWKGLKEEEIEAILPCLRSEEKFIKKGEFVYRMGDPISSLGVLFARKTFDLSMMISGVTKRFSA